MRNERIHLIIRNLELLLNQLKIEIEETQDDELKEIAAAVNQRYNKVCIDE